MWLKVNQLLASEWFDKMDFITSVCTDSTLCGGYINRWMGSPNPAFERAASSSMAISKDWL